jgi:chitinase
MYKRTSSLKNKNKNLKIMLAVGGWNHGSLAFSNMANNERRRKNFVEKAVIFLRTHNFDGLG